MLTLVPLFVLSLFHLSLAVVEVTHEAIRYRRLYGWRELRFDEVTACGFSKGRIEIGHMGLKRYVWRWGKLYSILDDLFERGTDLVTFIRQHRGQSAGNVVAA